MNELSISFDNKYIFFEGKVFDVEKDVAYDENKCDSLFWINFIKQNSIFSALNERMDNFSLNKILRSVLYEVSDRINTTKKYDLMCEFEKKFGSSLILEMYNGNDFAEKLSESWDYIIHKIEAYGLIYEASDAKSFDNWIQTKGKTFIEGLRGKMFSAVGIGVQAVLSFTGWGNLAVTTAWGALLAYDTYMAMNGQPNWFYIIIDVIGMIPGVSKLAGGIFKSVGSSAKAAASIDGAIGAISTTKNGAKIMKVIGGIGNVLSKILGWVKDGISWLAKKLGLTYILTKAGQIISFISRIITKISETAAKYSQGKAVIGAKWGTAQNVGHALAKGGTEAGIAYGITKGLSKIGSEPKNVTPTIKPVTNQTPTNLNVTQSSDEAKIINILNNL